MIIWRVRLPCLAAISAGLLILHGLMSGLLFPGIDTAFHVILWGGLMSAYLAVFGLEQWRRSQRA